ncbi:MAG: long-chain N-acyl amino acid synthase, partial [Oxalobacteraceae bacterium]
MYLDEEVIVSFESPYRLRDLCIPEADSDGADEYQINEQKFHIRMANSQGQREAASLLIKKMYAWRGYSVERPLDNQPNKITLVTDTTGKTVGTMTLCLDLDSKLPADENFRDKLDELRAEGRRLCEPSRLAIEKDLPYRVFAAMIHISYMYAHNIHGFT